MLGAEDAYHELFAVVGTDQVVWCFVNTVEGYTIPEHPRIRWELEIPDANILRFMNGEEWDNLIKIEPDEPFAEEDWEHSFGRLFIPADQIHEYPNEDTVHAIVMNPIGPEWIVGPG